MALGIGSCVTVFSMISAVLLAEWPYTEAERLAIVWHARANTPAVVGMSAGDVETYRASLQTFASVAAVTTRGYNAGVGTPFRITCGRMSPDMWPTLGVRAERGRWFTSDEDRRREAVVVISERMWRTQLGGASQYPGSDLLLDAVPHRVIGIMPASFVFPPEGIQGLAPAECWVPASYTADELAAPAFNFVLFGRLRDHVTLQQAQADAYAGARRIWSRYPAAVQSQIDLEARVVPLVDQALAGSTTPLYLFAAAAALLLLIGCSNVTSLLLTSLDLRRRDFAVRTSLGASRSTLTAQVFMEAIAMALAGGIGGAAIASGLITAIVAVNANAFPRLADARIDVSALVFAILCSAIAGMLGAVAPAWRLRGSSPSALMMERTPSQGFAGQLWRRGLIAFQIALAVLVLVLSGVIARSVARAGELAPGFVPDRLRVFSVALPSAHYPRAEQTIAFADEVVRQLKETPGVAQAAAGTAAPVGPSAAVVLSPAAMGSGAPKYQPAIQTAVTPGYAAASGMTLREGRFVEPADGSAAPLVGVINETLARALWPSGGAVGQAVLRVGDREPTRIVGVVGDVRQAGPLRAAAPAIYVPMMQGAQPASTLHFVVRAEVDARRFAARARQVVSSLDPALPPFALRTGEDLVAGTVAAHRFNLLVLGVFAAAAIMLALAGVHGVLSHFVQQSRRVFGIRQALGATRARIVAAVVGWVLMPVVVGVAAGGAVSAAAVRLIESLLFGISPDDPSTAFVVSAVVTIVALATVLPAAVRASRGDITASLRQP